MSDVLEQLAAAQRRVAAAEAERDAALAEMGSVMRAARGTVSVTAMAKAAGVSRVTAYALLDQD